MAATCPPPPFADIALEDAYAASRALMTGTADYWIGAIERGAMPWDVARDAARWWQLVSGRRKPSWSTEHEVVWESGVARLRDFSTASGSSAVAPTLVLPPQAGHDSCIVDYSPAQSQMGAIREAGLTRAFTLDWIGATDATKDATIDDYLDVIDRAADTIGPGPINLIGDCQGGWLATIYAALNPGRINTLTIAGAPIDFHCGEPVIHSVVDALAPGGDLAFYRNLVAMNGGVLRGEDMLNGFILIKPDNEVGRQVQLLAHLDDDAYVARYQEFEDWFKHTQDIPGAFYLWIVEHLFRDNELIAGELEIGNETVDLGKIDVPLFLLGGEKDHITPPSQVFALADFAATGPDDVYRDVTSGGHLGLFMSREALAEHWPPLLAEVAARSGVSA